MKITIPELSVVVLIGASVGKLTFARTHFKPTEILSSDYCRGLVSDDENSLLATNDAFDVLHFIAAKRLAAGKLVVVDATNVQQEARAPLVALARKYHCLPVAVVLNMPEQLCRERNRERSDRDFGNHVIRNHVRALRSSLKILQREGFRHTFVMNTPEEVAAATVTREPLYNNLRRETGPFDIIGDIHGCYEELLLLLAQLGYTLTSAETGTDVSPPQGRKVVFLGDLVDRGPASPAVLRLVMGMVAAGTALCIPGNHDVKLLRKLSGREVQITHGLGETLVQLDLETPEFTAKVKTFLDSLISHYVLADGKLVVAHAGMKQEMQGRGSGEVRSFALYGETTGETDEFGLPKRFNWAKEYRGSATVVYGHTPVPSPEWLNNTMNIDTGCVFGGSLTALRWPERETVSVAALTTYCEPVRPFLPLETSGGETGCTLSAQHQNDDVLDIEDVTGKRFISTSLHGTIAIREENSIAALEVMSRFAADPRWLVYLPPTMSPSETTQTAGLLEHPAEAFTYFRDAGVDTVVCEEKHMGSRCVVALCRNEETAVKRFGGSGADLGACVTRTGRRFFDDLKLEGELLNCLLSAMDTGCLWQELNTDWIVLDCELMPWSAKAQELLRRQYAAVGCAAGTALTAAVEALTRAAEISAGVEPILEAYVARQAMASQFTDAYRRYCWPVNSLSDLKLAPFHILATEGRVHSDRNYIWHMEALGRLCASADRLLLATPYLKVPLADESTVASAVRWWEELTERGGEGMVVKPLDFVTRGSKGLVQPALKCRGREYLRIIYGPEYTATENLVRLRSRGLGRKRSLALREFALGIEGLDRFVKHEPLRRVHECVFGVLALESEPVDPRL